MAKKQRTPPVDEFEKHVRRVESSMRALQTQLDTLTRNYEPKAQRLREQIASKQEIIRKLRAK